MEYIGSSLRSLILLSSGKPLRPRHFRQRAQQEKEIAMHFSHLNNGSGTKATKLAAVAGLHVLLGAALINSINTRHVQMPKVAEDILVMIQPEIPKPPPPKDPPKPMQKAPPTKIVVPKTEVETPPPENPPVLETTAEADPAPAQPAQPVADAPPAQPSDNSGAMRTAVLADPNGCAKPDYPANAARNGDTGTVTLALLVGPDGKVTSSRIQKSSGHRDLDKAAVNALSMCRFKPAMNNGTPESGWAQIAYVWTLEE
jgi:protein TonB